MCHTRSFEILEIYLYKNNYHTAIYEGSHQVSLLDLASNKKQLSNSRENYDKFYGLFTVQNRFEV